TCKMPSGCRRVGYGRSNNRQGRLAVGESGERRQRRHTLGIVQCEATDQRKRLPLGGVKGTVLHGDFESLRSLANGFAQRFTFGSAGILHHLVNCNYPVYVAQNGMFLGFAARRAISNANSVTIAEEIHAAKSLPRKSADQPGYRHGSTRMVDVAFNAPILHK